ncbi:MAG TPA: metallophosphoesterase [Candidatus Limnocylindria bacterium]|nr:metallophosphoesterase [Candidatus Limnocylindria bacterium]
MPTVRQLVMTLGLVILIGAVAAAIYILLGLSPSASPTGPDPRIMVGAGDIAECPTQGDEETAAVLDDVVADHPDAVVFTTGDNAYPGGSYREFVDCYGPSWGRHKDRTHPAVGNHEFKQTKAEGYHEYWGDAAGPFDLYYYSYDLGTWHIVVLNSECHRVGCEFQTEDGTQAEWLEADLAASDALCTIAIWHHPRWSSGRYSNNADYDTFWEVLYRHGAEIVLNGHEHLYERFEPMNPDGDVNPVGIRQFTVGTGGGNLRGFEDIKEHSVARGSEHGVLELTLYPDRYAWEFLAVAGADFSDAGSGTCHGPNA